MEKVDCADAVGSFDAAERVYSVNEVIDGTEGGCSYMGGFFPIEFVHKPDDAYCPAQESA